MVNLLIWDITIYGVANQLSLSVYNFKSDTIKTEFDLIQTKKKKKSENENDPNWMLFPSQSEPQLAHLCDDYGGPHLPKTLQNIYHHSVMWSGHVRVIPGSWRVHIDIGKLLLKLINNTDVSDTNITSAKVCHSKLIKPKLNGWS